jgi:hypothetical protein
MESPQHVRSLTKSSPFAVFGGGVFPFTSEFRIAQEFTTHPYQSTQIGFSVLRKSPLIFLLEDTAFNQRGDRFTVKGWKFNLAKRYYLRSKSYAPYGVYISPSFTIASAVISTEFAQKRGYYIKATNYDASILMGAQPIIKEFFAIDMYVGLGYINRVWNEHYDVQHKRRAIDTREVLGPFWTPVKISAGMNFGFGF